MSTPVTHRKQGGRRLADTVLTLAAILGVVCLILTVLALSFGIRPLIFETDSMAPAAPTGSLGISRTVPATTVNPGDIVTVTSDDGTRLTHRVVTVGSVAGNSATLTLKGDANDVVDPGKYVKTTVDRVYWTVPYLGYVVSWLKNPMTLALEGVGLLILLAIAFAPRQGWRNSPAGQRFLAGTAAASVVAVVISGAQVPGEAQAAPPLSATAVGTLATGLPAKPPSATCSNYGGVLGLLGGAADISISNPAPAAGRYQYELRIEGNSGVLATLSTSTSSTVTARVGTDILSILLGTITGNSGPWNVQIYSKVGNFYSPLGPVVPIKMSLIGFPISLLSVQCGSAGPFTSSNGPAARQAPSSPTSSTSSVSSSPSSEASSSTTSSSAPSESSETSAPSSSKEQAPSSTTVTPSTTTTSAKPVLPPGGTTTASNNYAFYQDGGAVTIRDASSTDVVYRGSFPASSSVRWLPQSERLEVSEPDGTVVVVSQTAGAWTEDVTPPPPPPAPAAPAPAPTKSQPQSAPATPASPAESEPVPVAPSS